MSDNRNHKYSILYLTIIDIQNRVGVQFLTCGTAWGVCISCHTVYATNDMVTLTVRGACAATVIPIRATGTN